MLNIKWRYDEIEEHRLAFLQKAAELGYEINEATRNRTTPYYISINSTGRVVAGYHGQWRTTANNARREITLQRFLDYQPEPQRFVLPERWCVRRTQANADVINEWLNNNYDVNEGEERTRSYVCRTFFIHFPSFTINNIHVRGEIKDGYTEITFEQFREHVLNQNQNQNQNQNNEQELEIMINGEISLRCSQRPERATNITVGTEYTGIIINEDNNQVDRWEDATHFLCTNNLGNEARYRIRLFDPPVPPAPTLEDFMNTLNVNAENTTAVINGSRLNITSRGRENALVSWQTNAFSCGIYMGNGINGLFECCQAAARTFLPRLVAGTEEEAVTLALFDKLIKAWANNKRDVSAFLQFSTNYNHPALVRWMDDWCDQASATIENPNGGNRIKIWTKYQGDVIGDPFDGLDE